MSIRKTLRNTLSAVSLVTFATGAQASPITYDFSGSFYSGPLNLQSYSGHFTFDSSAIVLGDANNSIGLLSDLSVVIDGTSYDETTANTGWLRFDALGELIHFAFGTDCGSGFCAAAVGDPGSWIAQESNFVAAGTGNTSLSFGSMSYRLHPQTVPEPASLALLGLGLAGLGAMRRRKH